LRHQGSGLHHAVRAPVRHSAQRHTAAAGRTATRYGLTQAAGVAQVRYAPGSLSPGTSSPLGTSSTSSMTAPPATPRTSWCSSPPEPDRWALRVGTTPRRSHPPWERRAPARWTDSPAEQQTSRHPPLPDPVHILPPPSATCATIPV